MIKSIITKNKRMGGNAIKYEKNHVISFLTKANLAFGHTNEKMIYRFIGE